ncbi:SDR family NAD(P)-dependent oxidoreductase [Roseomonas sp. BN140053]|uniref:SDR family NAD(P)-dependent oxidoreductase n=1 Tax=Roseomonas sp. BN140053 TaxID=3391898 RepID=UPI0039EB32A0
MITGAGSGIGQGIALAFAGAGAAVAVLDIRPEGLENTVRQVEARGGRAVPILADVSDRAAVERAAAEAERALGRIDIAVNNAGIAMHGRPIAELSPAEWDWVIGVNIGGVLHGMQSFLPRIRAHGGEGWLVNTASIGGFQVRPGWHTGAYSMTKAAVVSISEALEQDLAGTPVGVSVLCPAAVATQLHLSGRTRPERLGGAYQRAENHFLGGEIEGGLSPELVGQRLLRGLRDREFFIFTHSAPRSAVDTRHARLTEAFERTARWEREMGLSA